MNRTVFILAAGAGRRWHKDAIWPEELPKQLLPIVGTTIIQRTINMVRWRGFVPVVVTHNKMIIEALPDDTDVMYPAGRRWLIETLMSTRPRWTDINTVLWSDVVYSDAVMDAMLNETASIRFYGKWGDGFGLVWRADNPRLWHGMRAVLQDAIEDDHRDHFSVGRSWELYRWFNGWDIHEHKGTDESTELFERVPDDDYTCDIDKPEDWERVQREVLVAL